MRRVFVPAEQIPVITGSDAHHIRDVLRMKTGDRLELLDGTGMVHEAEIKEIKKEKIVCRIIESGKTSTSSVESSKVESRIRITLAQSLLKTSRMDFVVEKCTELGVNQIIPMLTERTVAGKAKLDRWKKIAKSAAEQSGRAIIPEISPLMKFEGVLKMRNQFDLALIPWELEKEKTLKNVLTDPRITELPDILFLVGPEGGFSQKEIKQAIKAGFVPLSLGKRILRAETAGMAVLAAIMYELG